MQQSNRRSRRYLFPRYTVSWYVSGRWQRAGRTFWTKRGARRHIRLITRNLRAYGVRYDRCR